jgi:predicted PurR-regulated permease PerM
MTHVPSARAVAKVTLVFLGVLLGLYVLYLLRRPISWVLIAAFIAIALSGPVNALQGRIGHRGLSITIVYVVLILIPIGLMALIVPPLVRQGNGLVQDLPGYSRQLTRFVQDNSTLRGLQKDYNLTGQIQDQAASLPGRIGSAAGTLGDLGVSLVNSIFTLVTILVLSVFLVQNGRRWAERALTMRPPAQAQRLSRTFDRISQAIGAYVGGALAQATVAGLLTFLLLTVLGVPFAGPLAIMVAFFDLIPLVGATIGAVLVGVVTLFTDFPTATIVWAVFSVVYQQVENTVIQPQIQRRAVDIHPFAVLVSVLFGATLFGVVGALVAIPFAASVQIVIREFVRLRHDPDGTPVVTVEA